MENDNKSQGFIAKTTLVSRSKDGTLFRLSVDTEQENSCFIIFTAVQLQALLDQAHNVLATPALD